MARYYAKEIGSPVYQSRVRFYLKKLKIQMYIIWHTIKQMDNVSL